jgi:GAF domain-containing protein
MVVDGTTPQQAFDELAAMAAGEQPLNEVLKRTVELAKQVVQRPVEASVTLLERDHASTPASTGAVALDLDEAQYGLGYGPCLAAAEAGQRVTIRDIHSETRWPEFTRQAADKGVRSTLSVPLPVQRHVIGALNFYSFGGAPFDEELMSVADNFGSYAAVAIANTTLYMSATQLATQLQEAMTSRAVIEQAKGMLMAQRKCDADEAFRLLVALSQQTHRKLRLVAEVLVERSITG